VSTPSGSLLGKIGTFGFIVISTLPLTYAILADTCPHLGLPELNVGQLDSILETIAIVSGTLLAVIAAFGLWLNAQAYERIRIGFEQVRVGVDQLIGLSDEIGLNVDGVEAEADQTNLRLWSAATEVMAHEVRSEITPTWGGWAGSSYLENRLSEYIGAWANLPDDLVQFLLADATWRKRWRGIESNLYVVVFGAYWQSWGAIDKRASQRIIPVVGIWVLIVVAAVLARIGITTGSTEPSFTSPWFTATAWWISIALFGMVGLVGRFAVAWWRERTLQESHWAKTSALMGQSTPPDSDEAPGEVESTTR